MPIAAGMVGHLALTALLALVYMAAQSLGATGCDVAENSTLRDRGRYVPAQTSPVGSHDSGQRGPLHAHWDGVVNRSNGLSVEAAAVGETCR